jgi:UPF0176 protein
MRRLVLVLGTFALVTTACSRPSVPVTAPPLSSVPPPVGTTAATPALPAEPQPTAAGLCPYLATGFVADANGQRVSKVKLSGDRPHPACFFYDLAGKLQLTVRVYVGEPAAATALVDHMAPVDSSNPATEPPGWHGGYQRTGGGAVYAVAKQGMAIVVTTDQTQTVKARTVAKQAISALGL